MTEPFLTLIDRINDASPRERRRLEKALWARYGATKAVLVLDMSHFSLLVQLHGIVFYLCMIRRMQRTTRPIVKRFGGEVVKYCADDLFAVFDRPRDALKAAVAINTALKTMNLRTHGDQAIHACIGISFGKILLRRGEDLFGDAVNLASKLGEDLADADEILVTDEFRRRVRQQTDIPLRRVSFSIAGMKLTAYRALYQT
jgi:adenylate cyclase